MNIAAIVLATFLRLGPICRAGIHRRVPGRPRPVAIAIWLASAFALSGKYDAVSGASASVSGLVKYVGTTAIGLPTNHVEVASGDLFKYRITVSNPGTDIPKNYFNCAPLPPGLTINTNLGAAGYITGTPTTIGSYAVTLIAGNLNYPTPATLPATILIFRPNAPPVITNQPASRGVVAGGNVTFVVAADGTPPLSYQWLWNRALLTLETSAQLTITKVAAGNVGDYQAIVSNAYGRATSAVARLTIREPFLAQLRLAGSVMSNDVFRFQVTGPIYTNYIVWGSSNLTSWLPLQTNWVIDGILQVTQTNAPRRRFQSYRATVGQ
jgi:uncharacterized repeat protein (TIGR01451 family)